MAWETRKFLVLVKTYPNPSRKASETVCTAAIDEHGKLIRLFPIPFRTLAEGQRFSKWDWISARVRKAPSDPRPESHEVEYGSIKILESIGSGRSGWRERWAHVAHLISPSYEAVVASGATLGLVKPRNFTMLFEDQKTTAWTPDEVLKLQGMGKVNLFGNPVAPTRLLEKMPVKFRYSFDCSDCESHHRLLFEDWEVCESWRKWERRYRTREILEAAMVNRYVDEPSRKSNLYLFLGNMAAHPQNWLVIGHLQPAPEVVSSPVEMRLIS